MHVCITYLESSLSQIPAKNGINHLKGPFSKAIIGLWHLPNYMKSADLVGLNSYKVLFEFLM